MNCPRAETRTPGRQDGAALVLALLVFALCTALVVAMQREFFLYYQRGSNQFAAEQAYAYLRGAEQLAELVLVSDFRTDQAGGIERDDLTEIWARRATPYSLDEGGWMVGGLEDLQGRFNLNALAASVGGVDGDGELQFTPAQQMFIRLLQTVPEPALSVPEAVSVTRAVGDWLDEDSIASLYGAEDDFYTGREPAYRSANRAMKDVSELLAVAGVTPELYRGLRPLVTVWPENPGPLNVHTAPLPLLRAINANGTLDPLSEAEGRRLLEQREEQGFENLAALLSHPVFEGKMLDQVEGLLGESSSWFLLRAEAELGERRSRLNSVLNRNDERVLVIARSPAPAFRGRLTEDDKG